MLLPRVIVPLCLLIFSHFSVSSSYSISGLGSLSGQGSVAFGLNASGMVVGQSKNSSGVNEAVVWTNGSIQSLGVTGIARAVNSSGTVVGETGNGNVQRPLGAAFSWNNGVYTDLGTLGGTYAGAYDINDSGQITGFSETAPNDDGGPAVYYAHGFKYENGSMTDLGGVSNPLGYSRGHSINEAGEIAGRGSLDKFSNSDKHAAMWDSNGVVSSHLGIAGYSTAQDINNNGVMVGNGYDPVGNRIMQALVWDEFGNVTKLDPFSDLDSRAFAVDDNGLIVGSSYDSDFNKLAFISLDGQTMTDLSTLVDDMTGWDSLNVAYDINELGQIVGSGTRSNGEVEAFILTSTVPVPAAAWLFGSALLGLVAVKRK